MCRCYAKNCNVDHFSGMSAKGRAAAQKRGNDKRQNKKFDQPTTEFDYADEQVYNKNIDDLMDYIMQPQNESKKNKKKAKKRKTDEVEEEAKSKSQQ